MRATPQERAEAVERLRALPQTLAVLTERRQWVVWKYEKRGGKPTKVPYDPQTREKASTTNPEFWRSFDEALATFETQRGFNGIGYVFAAEDPFAGVDLDDCLDENGEPLSRAQPIIEELASYTEISPSGRGVKIFLEAKLPAGGRRKGSIEMYEAGRYFTVTGQHLTGTPEGVEKRQEEVEALHQRTFSEGSKPPAVESSPPSDVPRIEDQRILGKARQAKNGSKFTALFDHGDTTAYDGDASRADAALCAMLAHWCEGDEEQIDRLFRRSRLYRPKWDSQRGSSSYGAQTIAKALRWAQTHGASSADTETSDSEKPTQAQQLLALLEDFELFSSESGTGYASIKIQDHSETWPLGSAKIRSLLTRRFFEVYGKPPGNQARQDALAVLEAKAAFESPECEVSRRVAGHEGAIYLDLGDPSWRCVEITAEGWQLRTTVPVKFVRSQGTGALPVPVQGGALEELRDLINFPDRESFILCCAFLVASLRPRGPYPAIIYVGEQGSAKTSAARMMRLQIDPSLAPLRAAPRSERDLIITASNSWLLGFDNLSVLPPWLSDALCRLLTGGGFSTRALYSNDEEQIFSAMRPAVLNGIEDIANRPDLLDRYLVLKLEAIPGEARRTTEDVEGAFEEARPRILGAICDAVSCALRNWRSVRLETLPRMADFARWIVAAEPALPWEPGEFLEAYENNRADAVDVALEGDAVATGVRELVEDLGSFEGTARELLDELCCRAEERTIRSRSWPQNPRALSGRLRRAATFLRSVGIEVIFERSKGSDRRRLIRVDRLAEFASEPSEPSEALGQNRSNSTNQSRYAPEAVRTQIRASDANRAASDANRTQTQEAPGPLLQGVSDGTDGSDANFSSLSNDGEDVLL